MKKKATPALFIVGAILILIVAFFGWKAIRQYTPSKEPADNLGLFGAVDGETTIFLDQVKQEETGRYIDGETYLPIKWVNEYLNDRFYWDQSIDQLVYALPERIVYADGKTLGDNKKPVLVVDEDEVFLSLGLVLNYTDVRIQAYDTSEVKRVYIDTLWEPTKVAKVKKNGSVRVKGGIKSPVVTVASKGEQVTILETLENWVRVRTSDGYMGYLERKRLEEEELFTPISTFEAPVYQSTSLGEEVVLVWHQVTTKDANKSMESLIKKTDGVNVISPTWFALTDNKGNYTSLADKEYVKKAHQMGIEVWALIDNFSKDVDTKVLMGSMKTREKLINQLMKDVKEYDLDGINLDFEGISPEAGPHYVQFIRELSIACRKNGTILSVDNYVPLAYNLFYNRREQGVVADYVIIMGYDEHYSGGDAGSVASYDFVKNGIVDTLKEVPKEKVILAAPFYTRLWTEQGEKTTSSAMGISRSQAFIEENDIELSWIDEVGQYYGELETVDGVKKVWVEDERSMEWKMELVEEFDLAGKAFWKLGLESEAIWDVISKKKP